jgi:hypothetical protein
MLSFTSGKKIAVFEDNKKKFIYLKDDKGQEPEIDTTDSHKLKLFEKFLEADKKLTPSQIKELSHCYSTSSEPPSKLERKYRDASLEVENSLKSELIFDQATSIFPIVDEPSYRMFVSGLSGSGKSTFISNFIKHNKPEAVFLFSPIKQDKALDSIKNLIRLDLEEFFEETGREIEPEDIPRGSTVIFDDVESFKKSIAKAYLEFRDILLERGRHLDISTICVSHNATAGNLTKVSIREAQYWVLFPKFNSRDAKNILKLYGGLDTKQIGKILDMKSRWVMYKKTVPKYAVGEHAVVAFD